MNKTITSLRSIPVTDFLPYLQLINVVPKNTGKPIISNLLRLESIDSEILIILRISSGININPVPVITNNTPDAWLFIFSFLFMSSRLTITDVFIKPAGSQVYNT